MLFCLPIGSTYWFYLHLCTVSWFQSVCLWRKIVVQSTAWMNLYFYWRKGQEHDDKVQTTPRTEKKNLIILLTELQRSANTCTDRMLMLMLSYSDPGPAARTELQQLASQAAAFFPTCSCFSSCIAVVIGKTSPCADCHLCFVLPPRKRGESGGAQRPTDNLLIEKDS